MGEGGVSQALAQLGAAVDGLLAASVGGVSSAGLVEVLTGLEVQRRRLDAVDVQVLAEAQARGLAGEYARASLPELLVDVLRVTRSEARARAGRATDLGVRRTLSGAPLAPIHPQLAAAHRDGDVSGAQASVITGCLGRIPAPIAAEVMPVAEAFLIEAAAHEDPNALARTAALLLERVDPDGREPREEQIERRREVSLHRHGDGSGVGRWRLTGETSAIWHTIFDALAAPRPEADGVKDSRSGGQRRHDALLEAGQRLLRSGTLPQCGGVPLTILARVNATDLTPTDLTPTDLTPTSRADTGPGTDGTAGADGTAGTASAGGTAGAGGAGTRSGCDGGLPGRGGGALGRGRATTSHGIDLSLTQLTRLAGDAEIIPIAFDDDGGILSFGRTRRLASCGQRLALAARDGGCSFPSCDRPAAWTEVHHVIPWTPHGPTDIDNLCLLCPFHHREFERQGWRVDIINGTPQWTPPAWLDPDRKPRRNTAHHLPDIHFDLDAYLEPADVADRDGIGLCTASSAGQELRHARDDNPF